MNSAFKCGLFLSVLGLAGCSVEAGKVPESKATKTPEAVAIAREEMKSTLTDIQTSVGFFERARTVIQRGLADRDVDTGDGGNKGLSILSPSEGDGLTFDEQMPDHFQYRLNNSTSISMQSKTGGRIEVVLSGTLDDMGNKHYAIREAKLEVKHIKNGNTSNFQILTQKKSDQQGNTTTEWAIDFRQLNDLYVAMSGDNSSSMTVIDGTLMVHISDDHIRVAGKAFAIRHDDVAVTLDEVDVDLPRDSSKPKKILIVGRASRDQKELGSFSLKHDSSSNQTDLNVGFSF